MTTTHESMTLQSLITEAFRKGTFGKNKKSQAATAEKLATWFSDYYGGTEQLGVRHNILDQKVLTFKTSVNEFRHNIIEGIRCTPCRVVVHSDDKQKELTGTIQLAPSGTSQDLYMLITECIWVGQRVYSGGKTHTKVARDSGFLFDAKCSL